MKRRIASLFALIVIVFGIFATPVAAAENISFPATGIIFGADAYGGLKYRAEPNTTSAILGYARDGTLVPLLGKEGNWYVTNFNGEEVYLSASYVKVTASYTGVVTASVLNLRSSPSTTASITTGLSRNTVVTILGQHDKNFFFVLDPNGAMGYAHKSYIRMEPESASSNQQKPAQDSNISNDYIESGVGVVTASVLNIRSEPFKSSSIVTGAAKGTILTIIGQDGKFYHVITPDEKEGYAHMDYVRVDSTVTQTNPSISWEKYTTPRDGLVQVKYRLMLRTEPSDTKYEVSEYLYNGDQVQILGRTSDGKFVKVNTTSGKTGWCDAPYVKEGQWVKVSEETTYNLWTKANSKYNAALACSRLTGTVIFPDNTFSWLKTMGACSKEKGYKESTILYGGKASTGYGGGVCQVSTTINMAVKAAGIKTVAQKHSQPSAYAKPEDEATVSYGSGIDFRFSNTFDEPIKLVLTYTDGICTCQVYKFIEE